ncbi:hypothetical protein GCM10027413_14010 [Conyzicola nivalis]|uniref:Uncharacterized protein n=1 Tax=Conyzicola nivalis TaxID=1477021 RepID=A0A916SHQ7_9MICO|nr:hypothetical protein [Conyzicola nivalis]GGA99623.1 hypothetical protein GCM10010979_12620 [Conyzicola nivalis]
MQWWNDFLEWFDSSEGTRVITTMVLPFVAIIVAGVIATIIARGSISRLLARQERGNRASAVEALIAVGEKASQWSGLSNQTREHFEQQSSVASIRVRLLPAPGAAMASAWAEYQLAEIKRNSANFSVQADQGFAEYRDRLIEWHHRPQRARKIFQNDLERFRLDAASADTDLIERQRRWKAEQATQQAPVVVPAAKAQAAPAQAAPATPAPKADLPKSEAASAPSTPIVPPASSRIFSPTTEAKSPTEPRANTEVIEATIDEDTPARTV